MVTRSSSHNPAVHTAVPGGLPFGMPGGKASGLKLARFRERIANIYSALVASAPSYSDIELWTAIEGVTVGDRPVSEQTAISKAVRTYDRSSPTPRLVNLRWAASGPTR